MFLRSQSTPRMRSTKSIRSINVPNRKVFIPFMNERGTLGKLTQNMPQKEQALNRDMSDLNQRFLAHLNEKNKLDMIHKINQDVTMKQLLRGGMKMGIKFKKGDKNDDQDLGRTIISSGGPGTLNNRLNVILSSESIVDSNSRFPTILETEEEY